MGLRQRLGSLLGISAYAPGPSSALTLDSKQVEQIRKANGGNLQPQSTSQTRWYMAHLEEAEIRSDSGDLELAAKLMRSSRRDGVLAGVLSTRTGGLVRLPKRFRGDPEIIAALEVGHESARSVFDEMLPATELALLAADGILLGVAVGELVKVEGRDFPVLVRLDPQFLSYRWHEGTWYYRSAGGPVAITPGDGQWVLHTPGGRTTPWQHGLWKAVGRAFIRKEHASFQKDNWEGKLANPARVAVSPLGSSDEAYRDWFNAVMAWGINTVFSLTPGYDVKLLESNGRGYESFCKTIADQNSELTIAIAGQTVTTDGGAGFQNSDIHKSIRADLIKETADGLSYTINTQCLPPWVIDTFGEDALARCPVQDWDVTPPKDRNSEANALVAVANALKGLTEALDAHNVAIDVGALCTRFGVPVLQEEPPPVEVDDVDEEDEDEESLDEDDEDDNVLSLVREAA